MSTSTVGRRASSVGLAPSLGVAALSKFTCPLCVAAYAGVLSSLGLGVVTTAGGLTALTAVLLSLNLLSLGWSARRHRQLGPLVLALVGSILVVGARVWSPAPAVLYGGTSLVLAASGWNVWAAQRPSPALVQLGGARPAGFD